MARYLIRRLLLIIPTLLIISFIVFLLMYLTPSNPGRTILGVGASQEQVDQLNEELGFNDPFFVRYFNFLKDAARGDFGESYFTRKPVIETVAARLPKTLTLTVFSLLIAVGIGVPLGILSAVKQHTAIDQVCSVSAILLSALPQFWLGLMLLLVFSRKLRWFPSGGLNDGWLSWVLPVLCIAITYAASFMRYTRTALLDTISEDYVRTARSKGCSERTVIWGHAFRNAQLTVVTVLGMNVGYLMGGTIIVENTFTIPGLGMMVLTAIRNKDVPEAMLSILTISLIFLVVMLIVDILYAFIDPRIRSLYNKAVKKQQKKLDAKEAAGDAE